MTYPLTDSLVSAICVLADELELSRESMTTSEAMAIAHVVVSSEWLKEYTRINAVKRWEEGRQAGLLDVAKAIGSSPTTKVHTDNPYGEVPK